MIDWWRALFFLTAAILILYQVVLGWRLGIVRQISRLIALVLAYVVVRWKPDLLAPVLNSFGVPELLGSLLSALLSGLTVYALLNGASAILLKRTAHQSLAPLRFVYGLGGAGIGLLFGLFLSWLVLIGVRVLGTVAESEVLAVTRNAEINDGVRRDYERRSEVSGLVRGLASLKKSMDQGHTGAVAQAIDPLPSKVYTTLSRVALLLSDEDCIDRFLAYPGAQVITSHPRMVALTSDAEITDQLNRGDYLGLLSNPNILAAANDPELASLVARFKLDEALEQALVSGGKSPSGVSELAPSSHD